MNTLKGHGRDYYAKQLDKLIKIAVEATENQQYSKQYLARLKDEWEQNKLVVSAYNILNVTK